ncbi:hypothetical protein LEMLEM_LOCUS4719 [Lemmus lemmus]
MLGLKICSPTAWPLWLTCGLLCTLIFRQNRSSNFPA